MTKLTTAAITLILAATACTYATQRTPPGEFVGDYDAQIRVTTTDGERVDFVRAYATTDSLVGHRMLAMGRAGERVAFATEDVREVKVRRDHSTEIMAGLAAGLVLTCSEVWTLIK